MLVEVHGHICDQCVHTNSRSCMGSYYQISPVIHAKGKKREAMSKASATRTKKYRGMLLLPGCFLPMICFWWVVADTCALPRVFQCDERRTLSNSHFTRILLHAESTVRRAVTPLYEMQPAKST
eukprot:1159114-Pelagomonas_calceolata.AAC.5